MVFFVGLVPANWDETLEARNPMLIFPAYSAELFPRFVDVRPCS
jgi:hypothetical protein